MPLDTSRLEQLAISDSGFAFDPLTGHSFSINATGLAILGALKEGKGPGEAAAEVRTAFDTDAGDDIERDIEDFLARLREYQLVG